MPDLVAPRATPEGEPSWATHAMHSRARQLMSWGTALCVTFVVLKFTHLCWPPSKPSRAAEDMLGDTDVMCWFRFSDEPNTMDHRTSAGREKK